MDLYEFVVEVFVISIIIWLRDWLVGRFIGFSVGGVIDIVVDIVFFGCCLVSVVVGFYRLCFYYLVFFVDCVSVGIFY